jgi:uncharacterized protein YjiS (DUF1127 family)
MPNLADREHSASTDGLLARWRAWWRRINELGNLDRVEVEQMARDLGMSAHELESLAAKGPDAADLLYQRMGALGVSRADVERTAHSLMRDLEKTCACCNDKAACRKDLAARPDDPAWKDYCPNAISLASAANMKGRFPL